MQLLRNLSKAQDWSEKVRDAALDVVQGVENGVKKFEFRVRGQPFVLEVQQARYYTQVGNRIWPGAVAFCRWLLEHEDEIPNLRERNVLEVGSGVGLVGLVAAQLAKSVTITDFADDLVAIAQRNANRLGERGSNIRCCVLDWLKESTWPAQQFDLALGSEVIYEPQLVPPLVRCISRCLRADAPDPVFLGIAADMRIGRKEFVSEMSQYGFVVEMRSLPTELVDDMRPREKNFGLTLPPGPGTDRFSLLLARRA